MNPCKKSRLYKNLIESKPYAIEQNTYGKTNSLRIIHWNTACYRISASYVSPFIYNVWVYDHEFKQVARFYGVRARRLYKHAEQNCR